MCEKMSQQEPVSRCTCTCGCCGEQAEESGKKRLLPVFAGICAYLAAYIWPLPDKGSLYLYGFAYLLIGKDVIQAAWRIFAVKTRLTKICSWSLPAAEPFLSAIVSRL